MPRFVSAVALLVIATTIGTRSLPAPTRFPGGHLILADGPPIDRGALLVGPIFATPIKRASGAVSGRPAANAPAERWRGLVTSSLR